MLIPNHLRNQLPSSTHHLDILSLLTEPPPSTEGQEILPLSPNPQLKLITTRKSQLQLKPKWFLSNVQLPNLLKEAALRGNPRLKLNLNLILVRRTIPTRRLILVRKMRAVRRKRVGDQSVRTRRQCVMQPRAKIRLKLRQQRLI